MGFGPPGRYEVPLIEFAISVDQRDLDAIHKSDSVDPHLAIVETIIWAFDCRSVEDSRGILKCYPMPTNVGEILVGIPGESHPSSYLMRLIFEARGGRPRKVAPA
jgi:hypothetical protein